MNASTCTVCLALVHASIRVSNKVFAVHIMSAACWWLPPAHLLQAFNKRLEPVQQPCWLALVTGCMQVLEPKDTVELPQVVEAQNVLSIRLGSEVC